MTVVKSLWMSLAAFLETAGGFDRGALEQTRQAVVAFLGRFTDGTGAGS